MDKYYGTNQITMYQGDVREVLRSLPAESVHCVVTSPPYWGLRDYGTASWDGGDAECDHRQGRPGAGRADGIVDERGQRNRDGAGAMGGDCGKCGARRIDQQLGLEATPEAYVERMVDVFREVRRVLRKDGTLWLNIGDTYSSGGRTTQTRDTFRDAASGKQDYLNGTAVRAATPENCKPKDLVGIPWMLAFALRADGWYLRQDIIWAKPNPMPESVTDRCTKSHEMLFLLSKSARYYYDNEAIKEPAARERWGDQTTPKYNGSDTATGWMQSGTKSDLSARTTRNKRDVWTIATKPYKGAHFATFPPKLIEPCILAGCPEDGVVLDPFFGSGTTAVVARQHNRRAIGIDLSSEYLDLAIKRVGGQMSLTNAP